MPFYNFKELRTIDLVTVLSFLYNAVEFETKPNYATRKYRLNNGKKIAITGLKWIEVATGEGGVGALDLVMYLSSNSLIEAAELLDKLSKQSNNSCSQVNIVNNTDLFKVPDPCFDTWISVKSYLVIERKLPDLLVDELYNRKLIWSDSRNNCVFPRDFNSGAYLRGTNATIPFKSTIGRNGMPYHIPGKDQLIITEAPIDAISLKYYYPGSRIIATGGRIGMDKIVKYLHNTNEVLLAQDNDEAGDQQAAKIGNYLKLSYKRLKPIYNLKDWNDVLIYDSINDNIINKKYFFPL
jgi:5S rRNA maturation endonuclease (ribonuclease M5)